MDFPQARDTPKSGNAHSSSQSSTPNEKGRTQTQSVSGTSSNRARVSILPFVRGFLAFRTIGASWVYQTVRRPSPMPYLPADVRRAPNTRQGTSPPISVALRIQSKVRGYSDRANVTTRLVDELVSLTTLSSPCGSQTQARNRRSTCPLLNSRSSLSGLLTYGTPRTCIDVRRPRYCQESGHLLFGQR